MHRINSECVLSSPARSTKSNSWKLWWEWLRIHEDLSCKCVTWIKDGLHIKWELLDFFFNLGIWNCLFFCFFPKAYRSPTRREKEKRKEGVEGERQSTTAVSYHAHWVKDRIWQTNPASESQPLVQIQTIMHYKDKTFWLLHRGKPCLKSFEVKQHSSVRRKLQEWVRGWHRAGERSAEGLGFTICTLCPLHRLPHWNCVEANISCHKYIGKV